MKGNYKIKKKKKLIAIRSRYEMKRHSLKWKKRKNNRKLLNYYTRLDRKRSKKIEPVRVIAPSNFSLINNTADVLKYFSDAFNLLKNKNNVLLDIGDIDVLSPESLLLLVASVNDKNFLHNYRVVGNEPKKKDLNKLFTESGFYEYVNANGRFRKSEDSNLHKEVSNTPDPKIVLDFSLIGLRNVFENEKPYHPLYEILMECMTNTSNHADPEREGAVKCWLYAYNNTEKHTTNYVLLDLGVGIFGSFKFKYYIKKIAKNIFPSNVDYVDDLLSGNIGSTVKKDNEIRGRGLPIIVKYAKEERNLEDFYIIANDVKINLKTGERVSLPYSLMGTMLCWKLIK